MVLCIVTVNWPTFSRSSVNTEKSLCESLWTTKSGKDCTMTDSS